MKLIFKFIGLDKLKGESTVECEEDNTLLNALYLVKADYPTLPGVEYLSVMYKAKKMDLLKSLKELGIINEAKLNLTKSSENKDILNYINSKGTTTTYNINNANNVNTNSSSNSKTIISNLHESEIIINNKQAAYNELVSLGYQSDLVNKILEITNKEYFLVSSSKVVEKCLILLKSMIKDSYVPLEYTIELSNSEAINNFLSNHSVANSSNTSNSNNNNTGNTSNLDETQISNIYCYGDGINGQLGLGSSLRTNKVMRINFFQGIKIKSVSCGLNVSLALDYYGYTYSWGKYFYPYAKDSITGKVEYNSGCSSTPKLLESLTNEVIVAIGTGANHNLAINDKGQIFSWGEGIYGQLGHGKIDNELYPKRVESLSQIRFKFVTGGLTHSIAISTDNVVFGWGNNERNQLNFGQYKVVLFPYILPIFPNLNCYSIEQIVESKLDSGFGIKLQDLYNLESNSTNLTSNSNSTSKSNYNNNLFAKYNDNGDIEFESEEISNSFNELIHISSVVTGTWFTAVTSITDKRRIYFFGNNIKKIICIDYFNRNNTDIMSLSANGYYISIMTNMGVYTIDVNNPLTFHKPILTVKENNTNNNNSNLLNTSNTNKSVFQGDDFILTNDHGVICYNKLVKANNQLIVDSLYSKILSNEIPFSTNSIACGNNHVIFVVSANRNSFGLFLFEEKIMSSLNLNSNHNSNNLNNNINNTDIKKSGYDCYIYSNITEVAIPSHSFVVSRLFNLNFISSNNNNANDDIIMKENNNNNNNKQSSYTIPLDLSGDEVLLLLELIYTNSLQIFHSDNIINSIENSTKLIRALESIYLLITRNNSKNIFIDSSFLSNLKDLLEHYIKRLKLVVELERFSKSTEQKILNTKLNETFDAFNKKITLNSINNQMSLLKKLSDIENNNNMIGNTTSTANNNNNHDEEDDEELTFVSQSRDYFNQFSKSGTVVNRLKSTLSAKEGIELTLDSLLKSKDFSDTRYKFNNWIIEKQKLMEIDFYNHLKRHFYSKNENLSNSNDINIIGENLNDENNIGIELVGFEDNFNIKYSINKHILEYNSQLFLNNPEICKFSIDKNALSSNFSKEVLQKLLEKLFNLFYNRAVTFSFPETLDLLELTEYLQLYNLKVLIELSLEKIIHHSNIVTLLEISNDYNLLFLQHRILIYIVKNFEEVKNKVELRGLSKEVKDEMRILKAIN